MNVRRWNLILALVILPTVAVVWWQADARWAEMSRAMDEVQTELESYRCIRSVPWGSTNPGRAWDGYSKALNSFAEVSKDVESLDHAAWFDSPATASQACWRWIQKLEPTFAVVRQAGHCADATPMIDWSKGVTETSGYVSQRQNLSLSLLLRSWQLLQVGDDSEAVRVLLDAMQFARDQVDQPVLIASLLGTSILQRTSAMFFSGLDGDDKKRGAIWRVEDLSRESLLLLRDGLDRLDRPLPLLIHAIKAEGLLFGRTMQSVGGSDGDGFSIDFEFSSWRFGFSGRWMCAAAVVDALKIAEDLPKVAAWSKWRDHLDDIGTALKTNDNTVFKMMMPHYTSLAAGHRRGSVALRVLRMLVADALGESHKYPDPFGTEMLGDEVDGKPRYWSVGEDGVSQGGDPESDFVYVR